MNSRVDHSKVKINKTIQWIFLILRKHSSGLEKLDKLELNHNKIEELTDYCFEGLPKLTSLSLDYNKIYFVQPRAFSGLDGELQMLFARLLVVTMLTILRCPDQLQTLSMAANKLSGVPQASLRPLHQLITLHFNDNNLTR